MTTFKAHPFSYNNEIVALVSKIHGIAGELSAIATPTGISAEVYNLANVDAVHYSTKIEGNKLTRDQVTRALEHSVKGRVPNHDVQEVLNYARARRFVFENSSKRLSVQFICSVHSILLDKIVSGKLKGHLRDAQNVIKDFSSGKIVFLPPVASDVPLLLNGLLTYLNKSILEGISPLVLAAIFHFEFVTIHPFMDGNGRLARLVTNAILNKSGFDVERVAALEKQHEIERARYYHELRSLQSHNFYDIPPNQSINSWIKYWLECLCSTYEEALERVRGYGQAINHTETLGNERLARAVSIFKKHKILKAADYSLLMGLERTQAVADLNQLLKEGVIERIGGGRSTVYKIIKI